MASKWLILMVIHWLKTLFQKCLVHKDLVRSQLHVADVFNKYNLYCTHSHFKNYRETPGHRGSQIEDHCTEYFDIFAFRWVQVLHILFLFRSQIIVISVVELIKRWRMRNNDFNYLIFVQMGKGDSVAFKMFSFS